MKVDGVFEGGGVKGIAFVGAICCLEEAGYEWARLAGTSAGSIIAALLAAGYTGAELKNIIMNINYTKLLDKSRINYIPGIGKAISLIKDNGIYPGFFIENWLKGLFETKGKTKFKDIIFEGESKLKIIATDITRREMIIIPDDLTEYGINPMEFEIWKAVRMSISIPLFFKPVVLPYKNTFSYIVDGGILSNFPVWVFDVKAIPRWPTFGFNLLDSTGPTTKSKNDILNFLSDLVNTIINKNEDIYIRDKDAIRIINIPNMGVGTTEFDLPKKKSQELFDSGYSSAEHFLTNWNFNDYVEKYRVQKFRLNIR